VIDYPKIECGRNADIWLRLVEAQLRGGAETVPTENIARIADELLAAFIERARQNMEPPPHGATHNPIPE
jgi:hypothetical protein